MQKTCQHIKSGGARCRAVALTAQPFCFWHHRIYRNHFESNTRFPSFYSPENTVKARQSDPNLDLAYEGLRANYPISSELPPLEDAESLQIALSLILRALADAHIGHKQAALMLYTLQIAAQNVRLLRPATEDSVQHIAVTDAGMEIAVDLEDGAAAAPPPADVPARPPAVGDANSPLKKAA